jgi:ribosomal protein S27AE
MCKVCIDNCKQIFPEVPDKEIYEFLMGTTCYGFGSIEQVKQQLEQNRKKMKTNDWRECYLIAEDELTSIEGKSNFCPRCGAKLFEDQAEDELCDTCRYAVSNLSMSTKEELDNNTGYFTKKLISLTKEVMKRW